MGRYDNFSTKKVTDKLQKKIDKLSSKRKPNLYEIDILQKQYDEYKLFDSCQIFGSDGFWKSEYNPNTSVMFSDDNRVMMFGGRLISYKDIKSYGFVENKTQQSHTVTKKKGTVSRALVGGAIAGGVGAIVGGMSAGSTSNTTSYTTSNGFFLQVFLKNGNGFQLYVPNTGIIDNKMSRLWSQLATKLQTIIEENNEVSE